MIEPYLVACGLLLFGSVLARALPVSRRSFDDDHEDGWDLSPREVGYLRRGPYGVVLTVLAELHGEGAVDLSRPGPVRRLDPPRDLDDRLTVAVYSGLTFTRRPRLLALLPRVRRACVPLRWDLRERALMPPVRRRVFGAALVVYAVGLALAGAVEDSARGSTVLWVLGVCAVAAPLARGPRRTLAGRRELALHRTALARVADQGWAEAAYLSDLAGAYGRAAIQVLCGGYVPAGALAPAQPSYEPAPVAEPVSKPITEPVAPVPVIPKPAAEPVAPRRLPRPRPAGRIFVPAEPVEPPRWRRDRVAVAA